MKLWELEEGSHEVPWTKGTEHRERAGSPEEQTPLAHLCTHPEGLLPAGWDRSCHEVPRKKASNAGCEEVSKPAQSKKPAGPAPRSPGRQNNRRPRGPPAGLLGQDGRYK